MVIELRATGHKEGRAGTGEKMTNSIPEMPLQRSGSKREIFVKVSSRNLRKSAWSPKKEGRLFLNGGILESSMWR